MQNNTFPNIFCQFILAENRTVCQDIFKFKHDLFIFMKYIFGRTS